MGDGAGRDIPGPRRQGADARRLQNQITMPPETDNRESELGNKKSSVMLRPGEAAAAFELQPVFLLTNPKIKDPHKPQDLILFLHKH